MKSSTKIDVLCKILKIKRGSNSMGRVYICMHVNNLEHINYLRNNVPTFNNLQINIFETI